MVEITSLSELKAIELEIMKKVHDFCEDNDIWYVLAYGTLLGAIRHNGFIPWDDDIDIYMTREGYERFEQEFPNWGKEHGLKIVNNHTVGNEFPRDMIKVCDDRTLLIEKSFKNESNLGVFIDVWPIDKVPKKLSLKDKIWIKRIEVIKRITQASDLRRESETYKNFSFIKKIFVCVFGHANSIKTINKQEYLSKKKRNISEAQYISFQADNFLYQECDLFPSKLHRFEDTEFYVPNNCDAILRILYGEYMTFPPKEDQKPHHIQDVFWK